MGSGRCLRFSLIKQLPALEYKLVAIPVSLKFHPATDVEIAEHAGHHWNLQLHALDWAQSEQLHSVVQDLSSGFI